MTTRGTTRGKRLLVAVGTVGAAWAALQLLLTHRLAAAFYAKSIAGCARFVREHPTGTCQPLQPVSFGDWLPYAVDSIVVLLALTATAVLLVRGGWRWAALLVTALPAANFIGGWRDARLLGAGWVQLSGDHVARWTIAGTFVDTAVVAAIAVAVVVAVPPVREQEIAVAHLLRGLPPVVVVIGWWAMRHPLPDTVDKIWLAQAIAFVVVAGLLCTSQLPVWQWAIGLVAVLPLCAEPIYTEVYGFGSLSSAGQHALFAVGTAAVVTGLPALVDLLRHRAPVAAELRSQ